MTALLAANTGDITPPSGAAGMRESAADGAMAGPDKPGADAALIHYGAAGLFFIYLQEKYGGPETLGKIVRRRISRPADEIRVAEPAHGRGAVLLPA